MNTNLNYEFNKAYYKNIEGSNKKITEYTFKEKDKALPFAEEIQCQTFRVLYPGLLIGLGYPHEWKNLEDTQNPPIKLGFSFDYVTGEPYIPGSSVKGSLRSAFHDKKVEFIMDTLDEKLKKEDVPELMKKIFGGEPGEVNTSRNKDVFFDAVIAKGAGTDSSQEGNLLDFEYITSHRADKPEFDGLVGPNPVRLLKIRPDVQIKFRYRLTDTYLENGRMITVEDKLKLFEEIITTFGMGAKTNVGYGQLESI